MPTTTVDPTRPVPPVIGARLEITGIDPLATLITPLEHDHAAVTFGGPGGSTTITGPIADLHLLLRDGARQIALLGRSNDGPPIGGRE